MLAASRQSANAPCPFCRRQRLIGCKTRIQRRLWPSTPSSPPNSNPAWQHRPGCRCHHNSRHCTSCYYPSRGNGAKTHCLGGECGYRSSEVKKEAISAPKTSCSPVRKSSPYTALLNQVSLQERLRAYPSFTPTRTAGSNRRTVYILPTRSRLRCAYGISFTTLVIVKK